MAGLHDIWPTLARFSDTRAVAAPSLDAAHAASAPACPPPMTMTSYSRRISLHRPKPAKRDA
jgi:hypothetical protein